VRTQDFRDHGLELRLSRPTAFPHEILPAVESAFEQLCEPGQAYRATGVILMDLAEQRSEQLDLFGAGLAVEKMQRLYESVDAIQKKYGKHTLYLGASYYANATIQHQGARGMLPARKLKLLKGETFRRRLAIPMLMDEIQ
jgi:hypothetical protein